MRDPQLQSGSVARPRPASFADLADRPLDTDTASHCERVARYAVRFANSLRIDARNLDAIQAGALLHDVGKVVLPPALVRKPGPLSVREWVRVRAHPLAGEAITAAMGLPEQVQKIVRHHHERWDGTGYPDGLSGLEIPPFARIVCIVDAFDALVSERCYDPARPVSEALRIMSAEAGRLFDPALFDAFLTLTTPHHHPFSYQAAWASVPEDIALEVC